MRFVVAIALVLLVQARADALTLLTRGKVAVARERTGTALFRFGKDRALASLVDPTCAAGNAATLQLAAYPVATNSVDAQPLVTLPCDRWRAARGGFVYADSTGSAGGVRKIVYSRRGLVIRIQGGAYRHIAGPVGYLEIWLGLGDERLLGRFHNFRANGAAEIVSRRPSTLAADGEAAFWDVLWGDDATEAHQQVALRALGKAAKRDRKDGHSRFLLGMMHLYRFGQTTPDYRAASPGAMAEIDAARAAFDAAVPLLWDGTKGDTRVPGFAAATRYVSGVVHDDPALQAQGLADLEAAVAINTIFNLFDLIGVVPPVILPTDPLYARVIQIVDLALNTQNAVCVATQPEVCGNSGMAPHNIEGALLLFGDLYAKGGILDDPYPFRGARNLYAFVKAFSASSSWSPAFKTIALDRVATADARVALYRNADPGDDPRLIGNGPGETCATCHHKR